MWSDIKIDVILPLCMHLLKIVVFCLNCVSARSRILGISEVSSNFSKIFDKFLEFWFETDYEMTSRFEKVFLVLLFLNSALPVQSKSWLALC
jgi:hypothetical protein